LRAGAFLPLGATLYRAALGRFQPKVLMDEIQAQIRAFADAFGRAPDFIDGHRHVHVFPQVRDALLAVMQEAAPDAWVRQCGRVTPLGQRWSDAKGLLLDLLSREFRRRAQTLGIKTNPGFAGTYAFHANADFTKLFPRFLDLLPDGSVVMCHPGFVDAELRRLDPLTTLREREYAFLAGDDFPGLLARHGVALA
jgi:predicted glycoside hydrolase/deacetylase ChbG (UPF0249 family)